MFARTLKRNLALSLGTASLSLLFPLQSAQAAVTYTARLASLSDTSGEVDNEANFSVTVSDFIAANTAFAASDLNACTFTTQIGPFTCTSASFTQLFIAEFGVTFDYVSISAVDPLNPTSLASLVIALNPGTFSRVGTSDQTILSGYDIGTLTVSLEPDGAVPEPSTWALMLLGFGALGAALRRSRRVVFVAS